MLSQKEEGEEFARILLSTILERNFRKVRIIPQKNFFVYEGKRGEPSRQSPNVHAGMFTWLVARGNQDIESIQQLVEKVKRKKEVGINYMKSWEVEQMARHI